MTNLLPLRVAASLALLACGQLDAQSPSVNDVPAVVASVRVNATGGSFRIDFQPGGRLTATNVPVRQLVEIAYQMQPFQIDGAPSWTGVERFDIVAKGNTEAGSASDIPNFQAVIRAVLADRFKLAAHDETKDRPIYALVRARPNGQFGPQLHASTTDCSSAGRATGRGDPPQPPRPSDPLRCGLRIGAGRLQGNGRAIPQLAQFLSQTAQRIVIDQTGLIGNFDFDLSWTPDQMLQARDAPAPDPNSLSLFTALDEQLGLRLASTRGPVRVLVIDHVERPMPD